MDLERIKQLAGLENSDKELLTEACSDKQAESILYVLETAYFEKWFNSELQDYAEAQKLHAKDKEQAKASILADIKQMFKVI